MLEERDEGTFFTGPLPQALAFVEDYRDIDVTRPEVGVWKVTLSDNGGLEEWGRASTMADAFRYALGAFFGEGHSDEDLKKVLGLED